MHTEAGRVMVNESKTWLKRWLCLALEELCVSECLKETRYAQANCHLVAQVSKEDCDLKMGFRKCLRCRMGR